MLARISDSPGTPGLPRLGTAVLPDMFPGQQPDWYWRCWDLLQYMASKCFVLELWFLACHRAKGTVEPIQVAIVKGFFKKPSTIVYYLICVTFPFLVFHVLYQIGQAGSDTSCHFNEFFPLGFTFTVYNAIVSETRLYIPKLHDRLQMGKWRKLSCLRRQIRKLGWQMIVLCSPYSMFGKPI